MCLNALVKQFDLNSLALGAQELGMMVYNPTRGFILQAGRVLRDGYATDVVFRLGTEMYKLVDLEAKTECVVKPMMATIGATRGFFDATRVLHSVNYVVNGSLQRDILAVHVVPLITQAALAIGRAISTLHWFVEQKIVDFDELAKKAASIGGKYGSAFIGAIRATHLMNGAFLVGLAGLIYQDVEAINKGEHLVSHAFSTVSLTADVASIALGFANFTNPHMVTTLAIVAASTGLVAWLTDPENK